MRQAAAQITATQTLVLRFQVRLTVQRCRHNSRYLVRLQVPNRLVMSYSEGFSEKVPFTPCERFLEGSETRVGESRNQIWLC